MSVAYIHCQFSRVFPGSATLQRGFWGRAGARRSQGRALVQDLRNRPLAIVLRWCLRRRGGCIGQDAMEIVGWQEGAIRTPGGPEQGLPAQEVVVTQEHGRRGPGEELAHGGRRVPGMDQVTAHEKVDW